MNRHLAAVVGVLLGVAPLAAWAATSFAKLRYDDVLLPADGGSEPERIRVGGEIRQRYERTDDPGFGAALSGADTVWLQRYSLFADLTAGAARGFLQVQSSFANGRAGGSSPVDEDRLSWQNAFLELGANGRRVRAGRQELDLGSGRLVDVREGPNVRRTFDAVRVLLDAGDWRVDALAARPLRPRPGAFDNEPDRDQDLWGIYATGPGRHGNLDLYYLGYRHRQAVYVQGVAEETRHSLGVRWWGRLLAWDWNWEALGQAGRFGAGDIRAWTVASETGHTWHAARWRPRLALSANIASGDRDPSSEDLQTFNPLFPRGNYFSEAAIVGPRNFFNAHVFLTVHPGERWSFTADWNLFWRLETRDGVYAPNGTVIRDGAGSSARFVGSAVSLSAETSLSPRLSLTAIYSHFEPGTFVRETGPSLDLDFVEATLQYRF